MAEKPQILAELEQEQVNALAGLSMVQEEEALQVWKREYLGKSSKVMLAFSSIGQQPKEIRPLVGQVANQVKQALEAAMDACAVTVHEAALAHKLASEKLDITLPGRRPVSGGLHVQTSVLRRIYDIFAEMGFQVYRSCDVESDEYNFELLNIPAHHPARDMWDTFHVASPGMVLRTHTSPGQIRAMRQYCPEPIRVILPGMCYRYEQISARSEIQFHQVEVLAVGKNITFSDMKGTLNGFVRRLFNADVRTRLRPSYFPFTEPSAEMDVECFVCGGKGCPVCKGSGWLEIMGCGMVHPTVLLNGGYDPEIYSGFAAGMGPERISMLLHKIEDIRYFWGNDVRFLEQF
ncbi:MAG: phenylalanine--tRNA ligase subunit alpha [Chloroflexi bacterium HGW-Chloroflexi-10]|nr:MAG: phenylalanine--tRNA ligase subunit alpha [Chloroflexi bacterium HGW-Chloroflexi-10]